MNSIASTRRWLRSRNRRTMKKTIKIKMINQGTKNKLVSRVLTLTTSLRKRPPVSKVVETRKDARFSET